jgi:purine-nucleoside phosphorylase
MYDEPNPTLEFLKTKLQGFKPQWGIILGSGLGDLVHHMRTVYSFSYNELPDFPKSTVKGHAGTLRFGYIGNQPVMAMQGRFHYYEGYTMHEITFPVRLMKSLGVTRLIVSNASGGMNPDFEVGDIMIIKDHINLFPDNPLIGANNSKQGPRFVDMSEAYDTTLIQKARDIAQQFSIEYKEGVYAGLSGPCFETPAEYRYLWRIGADAVGMSTVPEVIVAKHSGMRVFGISIITDLGIEGHTEKVSHEEVLNVAQGKEPELSKLIVELITQSD